jgi:hypothetical protein
MSTMGKITGGKAAKVFSWIFEKKIIEINKGQTSSYRPH